MSEQRTHKRLAPSPLGRHASTQDFRREERRAEFCIPPQRCTVPKTRNGGCVIEVEEGVGCLRYESKGTMKERRLRPREIAIIPPSVSFCVQNLDPTHRFVYWECPRPTAKSRVPGLA